MPYVSGWSDGTAKHQGLAWLRQSSLPSGGCRRTPSVEYAGRRLLLLRLTGARNCEVLWARCQGGRGKSEHRQQEKDSPSFHSSDSHEYCLNQGVSIFKQAYSCSQSDFPRLAGGTIPFIRKYSTICP